MSNKEESTFSVDGQLLMVMPRASASVKNPDVQLPILRSDGEGYYLEMKVEADSKDASEVAVTRRVALMGTFLAHKSYQAKGRQQAYNFKLTLRRFAATKQND